MSVAFCFFAFSWASFLAAALAVRAVRQPCALLCAAGQPRLRGFAGRFCGKMCRCRRRMTVAWMGGPVGYFVVYIRVTIFSLSLYIYIYLFWYTYTYIYIYR